MRNKEKQIMKDAEFIRTRLENTADNEEISAVPAKEEIVALCEGRKQKSNVKRTVRRCLAMAAALAVVIATGWVFDRATYIPEIKTDGKNVEVADDYSQIVSMISDYRASENFKNGGYIGLYTTDTAVMDVAEDYAVSNSGSTEEGMTVSSAAPSDGVKSYSATSLYDSAVSNEDSASTLNTREADVDESDIVRTDGTNLFVASSNYGRVIILTPDENGNMTVTSSVPYDGDEDYYYMEMYVRDGLLILVSPYSNGKTTVKIYDISDITKPTLVRTLSQDGTGGATRIANDRLIITSSYYIGWDETYTEENCIPKVYDGETESKVACEDIILADTSEPDCYCVITIFNLNDLQSTPVTQSILGGMSDIYCTSDRLFIYAQKYTDSCIMMTVRGFDLIASGAEYAGCCEFEGYFFDGFSMDWDGENLRVAATTDFANNLYIFDKDFNTVGTLAGFGENEQIEGIRFMGDTAYVVTFENTDPLFVIDLSDPAKPAILGELKMPGFSDYLHPVGENLMLGIGSGGTDDGLDGSAKASLYDVSDPANPEIVSDFIMEDTYFYSEYKAFVTVPDGSGWIVPYWKSVCTASDDGVEYDWECEQFSGAVLLTLNEEGKLEASAYYEVARAGEHWIDFSRATVINGKVYTTDTENGVYSWTMDGQKLSELYFSDSFEPVEYECYSVYNSSEIYD